MQINAQVSLTPVPSPPLFLPAIAQHSVQFWIGAPSLLPVLSPFEGIVLPEVLARAVPKRQIEFLTGRYCAREALRRCAPEHAEAQIGSGPNREPLWPSGIVGTITHTGNFASVAVARTCDARGIGLDCEPIMDEVTAAEVLDSLADPVELQNLLRATKWPVPDLVTLIFSAKESVFKGLYPQVGRYFDFLDVFLDQVDGVRGVFRGRLTTGLTAGLPAGHPVVGRFNRAAGAICTAFVLPG